MSDWEYLCDRMGWSNDASAVDKFIDYLERSKREERSSKVEPKPSTIQSQPSLSKEKIAHTVEEILARLSKEEK